MLHGVSVTIGLSGGIGIGQEHASRACWRRWAPW